MKKYNILAAETNDENEDVFRFAAIKGADDSVVYSFENCAFKEINDSVEFVADMVLLESTDGELVHLDKNDPRIPKLTEESDEILRQFVDELYSKMNYDVEHMIVNTENA